MNCFLYLPIDYHVYKKLNKIAMNSTIVGLHQSFSVLCRNKCKSMWIIFSISGSISSNEFANFSQHEHKCRGHGEIGKMKWNSVQIVIPIDMYMRFCIRGMTGLNVMKPIYERKKKRKKRKYMYMKERTESEKDRLHIRSRITAVWFILRDTFLIFKQTVHIDTIQFCIGVFIVCVDF